MFGVAKLINWLVVRYYLERPSLDTINRLVGCGIGASQGAILSLIVAGGLLALEPIAKNHLAFGAPMRDNLISIKIAERVAEYAEQTRGSALGRLIADCNLFQNLAPLNELHDDLRGLSDPWAKRPSQSKLTIDERLAGL